MKVLLVFALVVLIHGSYATLLIKGPTEPVLEGDSIKLECLYENSDANISQVHFQEFSKYLQDWHPVNQRSWCFGPAAVAEQNANGPFLTIYRVGRYSQGPYRCLSRAENVTAPDNCSELLYFKVHYLGELSVTREGYTSYLGVPQELKVQLGEDVVLKCSASSSEKPSYSWYKEGSDWILPSSKLSLSKVSAADEGQYTCMASGSVESLRKKRTVRITVLPENAPWYESSNGRLILMTSAAAVALLVFILSVSVFLCRRAKQVQASRGPIDDRSQKKPIYKGSSESLPSACGDKQPLV